ncbi:hypothetical protein [Variovorax ginsengisoli]|uniref:Uncharacterized protein n=1 Tax=Variovorax ginsengisoli TaxID=363844 RepID=A0ABT8S6V8_9BURK|nr:hypothetical protein [Variovorax ginsengisoli]MDN8615484.1 hypothetical protein [Variovorax ginsengisoli]MDO1534654.1 hypothetical protein [Variovorax ginsengisoli]
MSSITSIASEAPEMARSKAAVGALPTSEDQAKQLANLKAQLALRGFTVHDVSSGGWVIGRWDRTLFAAKLADLEAFLLRVGGQP